MYPMVRFIHLAAIFGLLGVSFFGLAAPTHARRKMIAMVSGIFGVMVLLTGIHMVAAEGLQIEGWLIVKLICWMGILALVPVAFRKNEKVNMFVGIVSLLFLVALTMVIFKPF